MKPVIIIPAYKPDSALLELVTELQAYDVDMIVVNDGSGDLYLPVFDALQPLNRVTVLHHAINLGKGQALKTAFNYFLTHYSDSPGVVTADADGQHLTNDIMNIASGLTKQPHALWLGARAFKKGVPLRSRFGNNLTKWVFRLLIGKALQDTQTGLRGIPRDFLRTLLKTNSIGYDFELDMLISASTQKIPMREITIETVYKDENKSSHFNPLVDSLKIYFVFILLSESLARIFSGTCNFLLNKELVFKSKQNVLPEALKYTLLCLVNLVFSYGLISSLVYLGANVYASKMIALIGLFFANFAIQKLLVFGKEEVVIAK